MTRAEPPAAPDALLQEFLATLARELRSPLTEVLTWIRTLRAGRLDAAQRELTMDSIESSARLQLRLIDDLEMIARHVAQLHDGSGAAEQAAHDDGAPAPAEVDLRGVRVIIVDDEPSAREIMWTVLTACGADVMLAASAMEALDLLQRGTPDVLISDISMPGADGYALLRRIRAPDTGDRGLVPAIAVTAHASPADRQHALAAGYQMHLAKPFQPSELIAAVATLARAARPVDGAS